MTTLFQALVYCGSALALWGVYVLWRARARRQVAEAPPVKQTQSDEEIAAALAQFFKPTNQEASEPVSLPSVFGDANMYKYSVTVVPKAKPKRPRRKGKAKGSRVKSVRRKSRD